MTAAGSNPKVFTLPSGIRLAEGLASELFGGDVHLPEVSVLLPTRRAVRALREAFLRASKGEPLLLPIMRPIGDVDEEALVIESAARSLADGAGADVFDLPPEMPALTRQLLLARAVLNWSQSKGDSQNETGNVAQATALAGDLGRLLDQVQTERLSFSALEDLVPDEFSSHWQKTLEFLQILTEHWPGILKERGAIDSALHRNRLLESLTEKWQASPPDTPVIAAGSTGSIPATADLLAVIARLPQGAVILPGLDRDLDDDSWAAIGPTHPQYGMKHLLETLGVERAEVENWRALKTPSKSRARLLSDVMRPAETTDHWHRDGSSSPGQSVPGLDRVQTATPREEAGVIALMMRETLETPDRSAALVTPDRGLARRVAAELGRWNIAVDDSAGTPLAQTPPGVFMRLTAEMVASGFSPVSVLAALKHPLAAGGMKASQFRARVRHLEVAALRGPRPANGFDGLIAAIEDENDRAELVPWLEDISTRTSDFINSLAGEECELADMLHAHVGFMEALAQTPETSGANRIWSFDAGEALAAFVGTLAEAASELPAIPGGMYPAILDTLMAGRAVRPKYGLHPRLHIWGPLEARLQSADLMILGGLNEGTWPGRAEPDPWLSRPMAEQFGLPLPERRIGLSAHDFVQAAAAPEVVLTRSEKVDGAPQVASRWWLRLAALIGEPAGEEASRAASLKQWHHQLNTPEGPPNPASPPNFAPPLAARPRRLSVTEIETLLRDPYSIYAKRILRLRALDQIEADAGAAERGSMVHEALNSFIRSFPDKLPDDAMAQLLEHGTRAFAPILSRPGVRAFWWPRFVRIAAWFLAEEAARRRNTKTVATEVKGKLSFDSPGGEFTLSAKADRIDRSGKTFSIIDYKTGSIPSKTDISLGLNPQLPLEAVILEAGGFEGVSAGTVAALEYWKLSGQTAEAGKTISITDDGSAAGADALEGLENLIAEFDQELQPYLSEPRPGAPVHYSDYSHLARRAEWTKDTGDE